MNRELSDALPPGPRLPAAMQLLGIWTRPTASLEALRRYGKRATVRLPFQPVMVMLSDPDEIREVFTAPPEVLHPGEGALVLEPVVGRKSVILLDEADHLAQRRLLLPAFHGERMQRMAGVMAELTEREVASWPTGEPVTLHPRLQRLTLEIILRSVFGLDEGPRLERLRDLLTDLLSGAESPTSVVPTLQRLLWFTPTQRRFDAARKQTRRELLELIEQRRAEAKADGDRDSAEPIGDDVLSMLLTATHEDGSPMSDQELHDELLTALVAGHETTASQLAWGFEQLARAPEVTAKLVDELDRDDGDEYLSATITEILRCNPVLPNAEPRMVKQEVEIGGVRYPPGVVLLSSIFLVHHDPEIYEHPYQFRPERFLQTPPGTYTWIPFGGGRRRCLGAAFATQEMKIVLRATLARFELTPASDRPERTSRRSITFSPGGGATMILRQRRASPAPAGALAGIA